jgi:anti-sigma regulatory factor (Ser/Thr protein kinase)
MRSDRGTMNCMTGHSAQLVLTMPAETSALGSIRLQLAMDASDSGADLDVVEELVLVASELASNVIRHTDDVDMTIRFHVVPGGWLLDVSGADSMEHIPGGGGMPDPMQQGGRGLVIVRAMMDDVELIDDEGRRWVRCHKRG